MEPYFKYSREIAEYLLNDMNQLQREAFEEKMKTDAELAEQVRRQKNMLEELRAGLAYKELIEDPDYAELDKLAREIVRGEEDKESSGAGVKRFIYVRLLLSAASIAFMFLINRATLQITPIHRYFSNEVHRFSDLWKQRKKTRRS